MKLIAGGIALLFVVFLLAVPVQAMQTGDITAQVAQTSGGLSALGGNPGKLLGQGADFPEGTSICDWVAMALALTGSEEDYSAYRAALRQYVEDAYAENGGLNRVKSTTYHRIALVVLALGGDPTQFGTKPDGTAIDLIADGTYAFAGDSLGNQGLNGWIYALLSLDASGVEVPQDAKFTREDMIRAIVEAQEPDGGFGLVSGKSDVDITAMALQALAPYGQSHPETVDKALTYLAGAMDENCRYSSYGSQSVESSAQVILALCALGIDPAGDSRFCRGDANLLSGLAAFYQPDGTFGHTPEDAEGNYLATAQTLLALKALEKLRAGEGWVFDFTAYNGPVQKTQNGICYAAGIAAAAGIGGVLILEKRRKYGKNNG